MQRITHPTAAPDLFGPGKNGYTEGTPGLDDATVVTADWLNGVQEELAKVIETAGLTLDSNNRGQLLAALTSYFAPQASTSVAGKVELATTGETAAGTDAVRAVTPAGVLAAMLARAPFNRQIWNSAGSFTWTVPAGVTRVWAVVIGGGGSGRSVATGNNAGAGGGGAGGIAWRLATVTPGDTVTVVVGAGGAAAIPASGSATSGNTGGSSSFGAYLSATGGGGGGSLGGIGGMGSNGDINASLGSGHNIPTTPAASVTHGGGPGGGQASQLGSADNGEAGRFPGAGGGGCNTNSTSVRGSGAGAAGLVAVFW